MGLPAQRQLTINRLIESVTLSHAEYLTLTTSHPAERKFRFGSPSPTTGRYREI
jgi:hypothetical protein